MRPNLRTGADAKSLRPGRQLFTRNRVKIRDSPTLKNV
jgi:hypothetical protein